MDFVPLHPLFAAEVRGLDVTQPLTGAEVEALEQAMARYAVLVFRGRIVSEDQQAAFTRNFGSIDLGLTLASSARRRLKNRDLIDLANVDVEDNVFDAGHVRNVSLIANQMWHSDSSFKNPPARYSVLYAVDVPAKGGETEFADQRAAYDRLPDDLKAEIGDLVGEHWAFHSRDQLGGGGYSAEGMARLPPVEWPLVRTVPESGRRTLFLGVHIREILGLPTAQARMLLMDLLEMATQRELVYRHVWRNHDLVMWDNRCTLHRGRRYDLSARRELRRCTTEATAA